MIQTRQDGLGELRAARAAGWHMLLWVGLFSAAVNLLNLTGPLFMMQVYDRVLGSRSVETLAALFVLVAFLFVMMGLLDLARNRVMARLAARFHERMETRVFGAALQDGAASGNPSAAQAGLADLDAVQRLVGSPVLLALFDLPWAPMFLAGLFIFHPLLGALACLGGVVLIIAALLNQMVVQTPLRQAYQAGQQADRTAAHYPRRGRADRRAGDARGQPDPLAAPARPRGGVRDAGHRPVRRLHGVFAHFPAVSAKRAAGRRGVAGAAGQGDARRDDRQFDPDGPGAGADRTDRRRLVAGAAGAATAGAGWASCCRAAPPTCRARPCPAPLRGWRSRT